MPQRIPDEELLMKYLDQEMSGEEKAAFEKRLAADSQLRKRVEEMTVARDAVLHYGIREKVASVRRSWEDSNQKLSSQPAKVISMKKMLAYGSAAAAVVIAIVIVTLVTGSSVTPEKIYNETHVSYSLDNTRSTEAADSKIEAAYRQKDYAQVIALGKAKAIPPKEQLLLGIAYLETNDVVPAIQIFSGLRQQTMYPYHSDADFYLGLAYLKNKEYQNAVGAFSRISTDSAHPYHSQVSEKVIEEIKQLK